MDRESKKEYVVVLVATYDCNPVPSNPVSKDGSVLDDFSNLANLVGSK